MKNTNSRNVKVITRNALIISMILHVFFLFTLFYFTISNQSILPFQHKIDASIETVPKTVSKKPMHVPINRQFKTNVREAAKTPLANVESISPELTFQSRVATTTPIVTEQPRLKQANTTPDVKVNVSSVLHQLREVEKELPKIEAADPTLDSSLGSKRPGGTQDMQRAPTRSTLYDTGKIGSDVENPTQVDNLQKKKSPPPPMPSPTRSGNIMKSLTNEIVETSVGRHIDVVFVIDTSGSMGVHIRAVKEHLAEMINTYKSSNIDYALGLTRFTWLRINKIKVSQLTKNFSKFRQELDAIVPVGGENALDAIEKTVRKMRFRARSKRHIILVTNELFTSIEGLTVQDAFMLCRKFGIHVHVLGLSDMEHQLLASETGGKWYPIPVKYRNQSTDSNPGQQEQKTKQ